MMEVSIHAGIKAAASAPESRGRCYTIIFNCSRNETLGGTPLYTAPPGMGIADGSTGSSGSTDKPAAWRPSDASLDKPCGSYLNVGTLPRTNESRVGVSGPYPSSFATSRLPALWQHLLDWRQRVRWDALKLTHARNDPSSSAVHILEDRCFAIDSQCSALGKDPAILKAVRDTLGPNVVLWAMNAVHSGLGHRFGQGAMLWTSDPEHDGAHPNGAWLAAASDPCVAKRVSVWVAVERNNPALRLMTDSHLLPSPLWLFPSMGDKQLPLQAYEPWLLNCVRAVAPNASTVSPSLGVGDFVVFNGKTWRAQESLAGQDGAAIMLHYTTPNCEVMAKEAHFRLHTSVHLESPPVALVSGDALDPRKTHTVLNNFVHFKKFFLAAPPDVLNRSALTKQVALKAELSDLSVWYRKDERQLTRSRRLLNVSAVYRGHSELLDFLEMEVHRLDPRATSGQPSYSGGESTTLVLVLAGTVRCWYLFSVNATPGDPSLFSHDNAKPSLVTLDIGGVFLIGADMATSLVGGPLGATYLRVRFRARKRYHPSSSAGVRALRSPWTAPAAHHRPQHDMINLKSAEGFRMIGIKANRCFHKSTTWNDRESLLVVEHLEASVANASSYIHLLPGHKRLRQGAVVFFPRNSTHSIPPSKVLKPLCILISWFARVSTKLHRALRRLMQRC
jgi:hypothetical protein